MTEEQLDRLRECINRTSSINNAYEYGFRDGRFTAIIEVLKTLSPYVDSTVIERLVDELVDNG